MDEDKSLTMDVFIDFLPNQPRNDENRETFREILRQRLEQRLEASVDRLWDLPVVVLKQPEHEYVALLCEARDLFISGYFYSCVAMCGIVGERLVKDAVRASVLVKHEGREVRPADVAFEQLERVDSSSLCNFLEKAQLLSGAAARAAAGLRELRNKYAHARGRDAQGDAVTAIKQLHVLVEDTVSVFKDFEIKNGALVLKNRRQKTEGAK